MINFYILLIGYALKCYKGQLRITKDTTQEQKEIEPELADCDDRGDAVACASTYAVTDVTISRIIWRKIESYAMS